MGTIGEYFVSKLKTETHCDECDAAQAEWVVIQDKGGLERNSCMSCISETIEHMYRDMMRQYRKREIGTCEASTY